MYLQSLKIVKNVSEITNAALMNIFRILSSRIQNILKNKEIKLKEKQNKNRLTL